MSMQKLVELTEAERKPFVERSGGWGSFPEGWKEIDPAKDHVRRFGTWGPDVIEYRQMRDGNKFVAANLYHYFDGTGFAIEKTNDGFRFYQFGCDHDMQHVANLGNCLNKYECTKCGYVEDIDSSD